MLTLISNSSSRIMQNKNDNEKEIIWVIENIIYL